MSALRRFQPLGIRFSGLVLTAWHSEQIQAGALTVVDTYFLTYSLSSINGWRPRERRCGRKTKRTRSQIRKRKSRLDFMRPTRIARQTPGTLADRGPRERPDDLPTTGSNVKFPAL